MKLISLNIWGGKKFKPLINFIKDNSKDTDIFCFQEIFDTDSNINESAGFRLNIYNDISRLLPNHHRYFASCVENYITGSFQPNFIDFNLSWGLAIFINKKLKVVSNGDFFVFKKSGTFNPKDLNSLPRNAQYLSFTKDNKKFTVCNLHGIWQSDGKKDSPSRISQSNKINKFLGKQKGEKILCGDLNLDINTQSIKILEKNMSNLIKNYNISTTRSKFFPGNDKFADYTFVSSGVNVIDFKVPNIDVSDHLPMILEFS